MSLLVEIIIVIFLLLSLVVNRKIKFGENKLNNRISIILILVSALSLHGLLGYIFLSDTSNDRFYYIFPLEFFILGVQYQTILGKRLENKKFNKLYAYFKTIMLVCFFVFITVSSQEIYPLDKVYLIKLGLIFFNLIFLIQTMIYLVKKNEIDSKIFYFSFAGLFLNTFHVIYNIVSIGFDMHSIWNVYFVNFLLLLTCVSQIVYKAFYQETMHMQVSELNESEIDMEEKRPQKYFDDPSNFIFENESVEEEQSDVREDVVVKYEKSKLKFSDIEMIRLKIYQELVKNKAFLDPELNLQKFSEAINISKHSISQVFSTYYQSNFKEFTNKLRCEHAIELMAKYHDKHIIEIAYMCGFNSKTSFYRSFNKNFNISPTDYLSKNSNYR